jgi:hypothetical protein
MQGDGNDNSELELSIEQEAANNESAFKRPASKSGGWESVRISASSRGALQCALFLGWLPRAVFPTAISTEKSARFV